MSDISQKIAALKLELKDKVCVVGHHYQADEIIKHCDITGDSLELARKVSDITAANIIFCGVYFMAESAALLARDGQNVYIPDHSANCVMSQMTPAPLLEKVLAAIIENSNKKIIPLAYVNTSLAVKDVVGKFGGAVCTSANAKTMLKWAFEQGEQVLFLPDKNLARNTARQLGLDSEKEHILNVRAGGSELDFEAINNSKLLLWPGCCAIHAKFNPYYILQARTRYMDCKIYVHPECSPVVVENSDGAGSTSYLIDVVSKSPKGSTIIVGTESNLVLRLRKQYEGHCNVLPLRDAYCSDMAKINAEKLLLTLQNIKNNQENPVQIPSSQVENARKSLERMLEACAKA